jgi:hypothetical protein
MIEPTNAPEASNPFSGIFKVANTQFYPLDDVRIKAYLWCAKIGKGTDTTPPTMCKRGMASSKQEWNKRTLAADDSYEPGRSVMICRWEGSSSTMTSCPRVSRLFLP